MSKISLSPSKTYGDISSLRPSLPSLRTSLPVIPKCLFFDRHCYWHWSYTRHYCWCWSFELDRQVSLLSETDILKKKRKKERNWHSAGDKQLIEFQIVLSTLDKTKQDHVRERGLGSGGGDLLLPSLFFLIPFLFIKPKIWAVYGPYFKSFFFLFLLAFCCVLSSWFSEELTFQLRPEWWEIMGWTHG